jgi:hypothetical protein
MREEKAIAYVSLHVYIVSSYDLSETKWFPTVSLLVAARIPVDTARRQERGTRCGRGMGVIFLGRNRISLTVKRLVFTAKGALDRTAGCPVARAGVSLMRECGIA